MSGLREGKVVALDRLKRAFNAFDTQPLEPGELIVRGNRDRGHRRPLHAQIQRRVASHDEEAHSHLEEVWPVELSEVLRARPQR